jgi:hypothetical protein
MHPALEGSKLTRRQLLRAAAMAAGAVAVGGVGPAGASTAALTARGGAAAGGAANVLRLARVWFDASTQHLIDAFDETHTKYADGSIELLLWPGDLQRLEATGLRYQITVDDLVARDLAELAANEGADTGVDPQPGERTAYRVLADFEADMRSLVARFPDKARLITLPHKSHEGRTIYGIEIGTNVARNDGRPVFYMDGVHHAREWPSAEMPIMLAFDLLESYGSDPRVTTIVDNTRVIIVPVMNPDGFHHSRSAPLDTGTTVRNPVDGTSPPVIGDQYWRKNRRNDGGHALEPVQPGVGAHGVDPNRNYMYGWGGAGASNTKTSDTYFGPGPLSEPETQNVAHILRTNHVNAMVTNHTSGRWVLYAWSWTRDDIAEQALVEGLGKGMASINGYTAQKSIDLYIHTGVCVDYAYGSFSCISYTFEHLTSFHPAYAGAIPSCYAANRGAYLLLIEEACLPAELRPSRASLPAPLRTGGYDDQRLNHGVITGRIVDGSGTGVAGTVRLYKEFQTDLWNNGNGGNPTGKASVGEFIDTVMETAADGTFAYHVNPSTRHQARVQGLTEAYQLTASAGGASASRSVVVDRGEVISLGDISVA